MPSLSMNKELLKKHLRLFITRSRKESEKFQKDMIERQEITAYYGQFTKDRIKSMNPDELYEYLSKLWAMLIWGNKHYVIDKIVDENGFDELKNSLSEVIWDENDIAERWDIFRSKIKGIGPAMLSEILCRTKPNDYLLWNRRAFVGLNYLEVRDLPRYDYQLNGEVYKYLCEVGKAISSELKEIGFEDYSLLAVDYFIWDELQVAENLSAIHSPTPKKAREAEVKAKDSQFIHNDIRDKIRDVGQWLGFDASIERKVSEGARVDAIWEVTIGNMGKVIYVFEVQTKGAIDSLILNLLKSLNNPAVQGVVAVSDRKQLEDIRKQALAVKDLRDKLKYWEYEEVLQVHESLEFVNSKINNLNLVPESF